LRRGKQIRILDDQLMFLSINKCFIIITKDDDFVKSWVSRKVPEKLIFIYHNGKKDELIQLFRAQIDLVLQLIMEFDFIELNENGIRLPFENTLPYK
jgi:predicted nuclease of predicted toxin-antitoxin system